MMDEATVATVRGLVAKGCFGGGVFETADCKRTYDSGNRCSLTQRSRRGAADLARPHESAAWPGKSFTGCDLRPRTAALETRGRGWRSLFQG
ncbi:hypothetical protein SAMN02745121_06407 [Nannocystis exedens]|uniref:Uncharacterized protein n=1 Tax=Nannocystis exedens TaxID=54 RepID=A0A1I2F296_9BACT|nr:hypothetical protein NAEX_02622 [Nannocystis exedens]SFE98967.1 hypothetical protein SAMN02745121_06407 [Nannocystis exedens]